MHTSCFSMDWTTWLAQIFCWRGTLWHHYCPTHLLEILTTWGKEHIHATMGRSSSFTCLRSFLFGFSLILLDQRCDICVWHCSLSWWYVHASLFVFASYVLFYISKAYVLVWGCLVIARGSLMMKRCPIFATMQCKLPIYFCMQVDSDTDACFRLPVCWKFSLCIAA